MEQEIPKMLFIWDETIDSINLMSYTIIGESPELKVTITPANTDQADEPIIVESK